MSLPDKPDCSSFNLPKIAAGILSIETGKGHRLAKIVRSTAVGIELPVRLQQGQMRLEGNDSRRRMASTESRILRTISGVVTPSCWADHSTLSLPCSSRLRRCSTSEWRHSSPCCQCSTLGPCHSSRAWHRPRNRQICPHSKRASWYSSFLACQPPWSDLQPASRSSNQQPL